MKFGGSSDQSLLTLYENVRQQLAADLKNSNGRYRLLGEHAKQYAQELRDEMVRRGLRFEPIEWP
ncbi:MAG: hypothetical protein HY852_03170 [Bradyrhizobium sp.]|uniref:hypothetical protein n=1 Tax=Bradyrhizobium sp. TaxID=376 RepID=UPI0025C478AB|nr:hypothetical protein [Bradyrhizobium sp.]MBI5260804.1 hypothetical protein [Bradyrhizobium sp.]